MKLVKGKNASIHWKNWGILGIIWGLGVICDRLWFSLDQSVPAWDQAEYLNGALNYWQALQDPNIFSVAWWVQLWQLSSKVPPFFFLSTVPILNGLGTGGDQASVIQSIYSGILLTSVYGLGTKLFNPRLGLWAAGLCQILPGLYRYRVEFLLDYPLTAIITLCFYTLTLWHWSQTKHPVKTTCLAIGFGVTLGIAALTKQPAAFFLITPILVSGIQSLLRRHWGKFSQWLLSLGVATVILYPWYRTNWLLMLTGGKRATLDSAIAEGDPALNTLEAWVYYLKITPYLVSIPLLMVAVVGLAITITRKKFFQPQINWLLIFLIGAYFLSSLNINKDARYVLPYLPVLTLVFAYGLQSWDLLTRRWGRWIRWETAGFVTLLMLLNLYPLGGEKLTQAFSPRVQHYPYLGQPFPHPQVINQITQTEPYLKATLGVLPSTPFINQHNFSFYGALANFQVYGRQVGTNVKQVWQDARVLSWFITKTADQGSVPQPAQSQITQIVETGGDFELAQTWSLPDQSTLKLYHQKSPPIQVQALPEIPPPDHLQLQALNMPVEVPPGVPVPVTYQWIGTGKQLKSGLVLLTWRKKNWQPENLDTQRWIHDHGLALGKLQPRQVSDDLTFQVTEQLAMLPPKDITPGNYRLKAIYFNSETGETVPIATPPISLRITPGSPVIPARELDLITQLHQIAQELPKGMQGLEQIFQEVGRINQYDPKQDYLRQAETTLAYRLQREPTNLEWAYTVGLAKVLQQDVAGSLETLTQITQLDRENPYAYAYLGFVYLYNWQPRQAERVLAEAIALNPQIAEIHALKGVAALFQGKLWTAWQELQWVMTRE